MPHTPRFIDVGEISHDHSDNLLDYLIGMIAAEPERVSLTGTILGIRLVGSGHPLDGSKHAKHLHVPLPIGYVDIAAGNQTHSVPLRAMNPLEALLLQRDLVGTPVEYDARTTRFEWNHNTNRQLVLTQGTLSYRNDDGRVTTGVSAWHWR